MELGIGTEESLVGGLRDKASIPKATDQKVA